MPIFVHSGVAITTQKLTLLFDPCWVAVFFVVTGALERRPARETVANLRAEWRAAVCGSWAVSAVLFPIQWASFRCLPVEARVLRRVDDASSASPGAFPWS